MGTEYLIDTNVIIDFSEGRLPTSASAFLSAIIDEHPCISVITKMELLGFSTVSQPIIDFVEEALVVGLTDEIVNQTISLRKRHKMKLPDAIIAATALVQGAAILSHNVRAFQNIEGLKCIDSHEL